MHGPTLLFAILVLISVTTATLFFAWMSNKDARGLREWFVGSLLSMLNAALFLVRDLMAPALSVFLLQGLSMGTGLMMLVAAYQYLQGVAIPWWRLGLMVLAGLASVVIVDADLIYSFGVGSIVTGLFFIWGAVLYWREGAAYFPARKFCGTISLLHGTFLCLRVFLYQSGAGSLLMEQAGWMSHQLIILEQLVMIPLLGLSVLLLVSESRLTQLKALAEEDSLTGAYNRRAFLQSLEMASKHVEKTSQPLSILVVDVDHFKSINDKHGHNVGDEALRKISALMGACLRRGDVLGRIGGEEFAIYLPNTDRQAALGIAERIRANVCAVPLRLGEVSMTCSVSIGVSTFKDGDSLDEVLIRGDRGMYSAKFNGRNRIEFA